MVNHHLSPPFENISFGTFFQASWPSFKSVLRRSTKNPGFHSFKKKQPHEVARDVETPVVDIDEDRMTRTIGGGGGNESSKGKGRPLW